MIYIDFKSKPHTLEEHLQKVEELLNDGYMYVGNTYGNPRFYNPDGKEDVCILASVVTQEGYFAI